MNAWHFPSSTPLYMHPSWGPARRSRPMHITPERLWSGNSIDLWLIHLLYHVSHPWSFFLTLTRAVSWLVLVHYHIYGMMSLSFKICIKQLVSQTIPGTQKSFSAPFITHRLLLNLFFKLWDIGWQIILFNRDCRVTAAVIISQRFPFSLGSCKNFRKTPSLSLGQIKLLSPQHQMQLRISVEWPWPSPAALPSLLWGLQTDSKHEHPTEQHHPAL